jgi:hypothetical protein
MIEVLFELDSRNYSSPDPLQPSLEPELPTIISGLIT